jgi:O-antigen/teichoic acid export membrane protein
MSKVRSAFLLASLDRYLVTIVNLSVTVIISRLLDPSEFGLSVLAASAWLIVECVRDLGTSNYIIQKTDLNDEAVRTVFTVTLILTVLVAIAVALLASTAAAFYQLPDLEKYLYVTILGFVIGPFVHPINALIRRDMAFGILAFMNVAVTVINGAVCVLLVSLGYSYMSFAWANLASGLSGTLLSLYFYPRFDLYRLTFGEWRGVLRYGIVDSSAALLSRLWDSLPQLMLGRLLSAEAVGLYQRGTLLCRLPERTLLAGLGAVALPAFAHSARTGRDLKDGFLRAISIISGVQWPGLLVLVLLAHPIVSILLGSRWLDTVPIVQAIGAAMLLSLPASVSNATLIAAGGIRQTLTFNLISVPLSVGILWLAAPHGIEATALSMIAIIPLQTCLMMHLIRRRVGFQWRELATATYKSAIVVCLCAAGPVLIIAAAGFRMDLLLGPAFMALILAGIGWLAGLWLTDHPIYAELLKIRDALRHSPMGSRAAILMSRFVKP